MNKYLIVSIFLILLSCNNNSLPNLDFKQVVAIDLQKFAGDKDYRSAGSFFYENDTIASHFFINQDKYLLVLKLDSLSSNFKVEQVPELHSYKNAWYTGVGKLYYNLNMHNSKEVETIELSSDGSITKVTDNDSISEYHIKYSTLTARFNNEDKARFYIASENEPAAAEIIFYKPKDGYSYAFILLLDSLTEHKRELHDFLFQ